MSAVGWEVADLVVRGAQGFLDQPLEVPVTEGVHHSPAVLAGGDDAAREVFCRMMDAVDPALVSVAETALSRVAGVEGVTEVRMRWIGHQLRAEATIVVDGSLSLWSAHQIAVDAEHSLLHAVPRLTVALIHTDPTHTGGEDPHAALAHHRVA